jgi:hypothetical protein
MLNKQISIPLVLGAMLGAAVVHFLYPRIEERVEYKDRVKIETKVVTRIVERKAPDGTSEIVTEITDTGTSTRDTSLVALKAVQKQYLVGVNVSSTWGHFETPEYSLILGRRIAGPFLGAVNVSKERAGAALYFEF